MVGSGKLAWRTSEKEHFFSPKKDVQAAFLKEVSFEGVLDGNVEVDTQTALRICEDRQFQWIVSCL